MESLTDRMTRYLLARIRRLAILDLYESAAVAGLLEADFLVPGEEKSGTVWRVPEQSLHLLQTDPRKARDEVMRRLGKVRRKTTELDVLNLDFNGESTDASVRMAQRERTDRENLAAARRPLKAGADHRPAKTLLPLPRDFLAVHRRR